jgi:hypothetical protein
VESPTASSGQAPGCKAGNALALVTRIAWTPEGNRGERGKIRSIGDMTG